MKLKHPILLIASLLSAFSAAALGSLFTTSSIATWYEFLKKPVFNPPNWLFGPVWTLLYFLMAISLYLMWRKARKNKSAVNWVKVFYIHLGVNVLWSFVFFGTRQIGLALIVISLLWGMILYLIIKARKFSMAASYLLYPYLAWVSFASFLNFFVWRLN